MFLFQKIKIFRQKAIYELLRRCGWCEGSSDYLINLLSYHLSQKSLLSLQMPRPLLEKCLRYSFINPKLAILVHGCLGYLDKQLSISSKRFLSVVSYLTLEGLPYIYLACVSANPTAATEIFKTCLKLEDEKIKLQSLLLISNYLNGVQRRHVIELLMPERIIEIQSRPIFNIALLLINEKTRSALLKDLISVNYVIQSPRVGKCGIGYEPDPPRLIFASSLWKLLPANDKNLIIERLIAMLYHSSLINEAFREFSSLSCIMEKQYYISFFNEISNCNLFFPIKSRGMGRTSRISIDFFRRILPNIWANLEKGDHERGVNMVLFIVKTDFFHKNEYAQDSLRYYFNVLSEQYISVLFIRLIDLVQNYNADDLSTNFDDIMMGVSRTLNLLQDRLSEKDVDLLKVVLSNWFSSSFKHKILSSWILNNVYDIFHENDKVILVELLMKNFECEDEDVKIFSIICLLHVNAAYLNSNSVRWVIDIFAKKYSTITPKYSLQVVLDNFRQLFVKLDSIAQSSFVKDLIDGNLIYRYNDTNFHIILATILDLIDSSLVDKIEKGVLHELNNEYRHSGFGIGDGFNELLERMSFLDSIRNALIAIYNKSPDNIKYLPESFQQKIYKWLPIQKTQSKMEKMVMNRNGRNCQYLRTNNEFSFFSNRWNEMTNRFQGDTVRYVRNKVGELTDYGDLAIVMMLWPKISDAEKEALEGALTKRFPTKRITTNL